MTMFESLTRRNGTKCYKKLTKLFQRVENATKLVTDKFYCLKEWILHFMRLESWTDSVQIF